VAKSIKINVPTVEAGDCGEKFIQVKIDISKKYILAPLLNCIINDFGPHVNKLYFVEIIILLGNFSFSLINGLVSPN
jgi:hypothetical protein